MTEPDAAPTPAPTTKGGGRPRSLKGGRSRNPYVDPSLWAEVPRPKSPFVREALADYLLNPEPDLTRPRDASGRYQTGDAPPATQVGVYVEDAQWTAIVKLPGTITAHLNAALRRKLEQR